MGESRAELIGWLNGLLDLSITKIEQLGTGAAYCQIIDSIYGDAALHKVKFDTKQEYEYINNFKVLQDSFTRHNIDKPIPVDRLIKCKFQDNLEFLQWIKKFWETNSPIPDYDPVARRKQGPKGGSAPVVKKPAGSPPPTVVSASTPVSTTTTTTTTSKPPVSTASSRTTGIKTATTVASGTVNKTNPPSASKHPTTSTTSTATHHTSSNPSGVSTTSNNNLQNHTSVNQNKAHQLTSNSHDAHKIEELEKQITELKLNLENLAKERDFYFGKLRDIEILVQNLESNPQPENIAELIPSIQQILYNTEEGFEIPPENPDEETF